MCSPHVLYPALRIGLYRYEGDCTEAGGCVYLCMCASLPLSIGVFESRLFTSLNSWKNKLLYDEALFVIYVPRVWIFKVSGKSDFILLHYFLR